MPYKAHFITKPIILPWQTVAFLNNIAQELLIEYPVDILMNITDWTYYCPINDIAHSLPNARETTDFELTKTPIPKSMGELSGELSFQE